MTYERCDCCRDVPAKDASEKYKALLDDLNNIFRNDDDCFNCLFLKIHEVLPDKLIEVTYDFPNSVFWFSAARKRMNLVNKLKKKYGIRDADFDITKEGSVLKLTITFRPKEVRP